LDELVYIKSIYDLFVYFVGLLKSQDKNVISAINSGGGKLAGIIKTFS
jgi:large subunit ribosomal protein L10